MWFARTLLGPRNKEVLDGTLTVLDISAADPTATAQRYKLTGVVQADGLDPTGIRHRGVAPVAKWPKHGTVLPVRITRRWPVRVVVQWDAVGEENAAGD
jgi:hypothetical protein